MYRSWQNKRKIGRWPDLSHATDWECVWLCTAGVGKRMKCTRRLRWRQTLKRRKFARQLHISEACHSGCKLHLERSIQCSPPPLAIVEKQRMRSRWRKPGEPREPKRKRPPFYSAQDFFCRRLTLPACARYLSSTKAPGSRLHRRLIFIVSRPQFRPTTM
jgi:hypothetical protein